TGAGGGDPPHRTEPALCDIFANCRIGGSCMVAPEARRRVERTAMETRLSGGGLAGSDGAASPPEGGFAPAPASLASSRLSAARIPLAVTIAIYAVAFLVPSWPWLSGRVTIPWDAKSQFFPPVQFLATSIARGEWPWWTPNVFAGWPEIADPQSLLFSPLY